MKRILVVTLLISLILSACQNQKMTEMKDNPFFTEWNTPFEVPPFDMISVEDYMPAYAEGMNIHNVEVETIISNPDPATFENTLVAFFESALRMIKETTPTINELNAATTTQ